MSEKSKATKQQQEPVTEPTPKRTKKPKRSPLEIARAAVAGLKGKLEERKAKLLDLIADDENRLAAHKKELEDIERTLTEMASGNLPSA